MRISAYLFTCLLTGALLSGCDLDVSPTGEVEEGSGGGGGGGGGTTTVSFALDILPIFESDCIRCHGGAGGLNVDSYEGLIAGGNSGQVVIPGNGAGSLLPRRLDGTLPPTMPLDGPALTAAEVDRIRTWIDEGAQDN